MIKGSEILKMLKNQKRNMENLKITTDSIVELYRLSQIAKHGREGSEEMKAIDHLLSDLAYIDLKDRLKNDVGFDVDEFKKLSATSPYQFLESVKRSKQQTE